MLETCQNIVKREGKKMSHSSSTRGLSRHARDFFGGAFCDECKSCTDVKSNDKHHSTAASCHEKNKHFDENIGVQFGDKTLTKLCDDQIKRMKQWFDNHALLHKHVMIQTELSHEEKKLKHSTHVLLLLQK